MHYIEMFTVAYKAAKCQSFTQQIIHVVSAYETQLFTNLEKSREDVAYGNKYSGLKYKYKYPSFKYKYFKLVLQYTYTPVQLKYKYQVLHVCCAVFRTVTTCSSM